MDLLTISNSQKIGRAGRVGRAAPSFLYGGSHHKGEVTVTIPTLLDWKAVRSPPLPLLPVRITDVRLSPKVCWHQERKFEWPENPCSYLKRKECNCNFLFIRDMNVYVIHTSVFFLKGPNSNLFCFFFRSKTVTGRKGHRILDGFRLKTQNISSV